MLLLFYGFGGLADLNHDKPLAEALGQMVVAWSNAEQALVSVKALLSHSHSYPEVQEAYYRDFSFKKRIGNLREEVLAWTGQGYDKAALLAAIDGLQGAAGTRNRFVHGTWLWQNGSGITYVTDHRKDTGEPDRLTPINAFDIEHHVQEVRRNAETIWALLRC
ncbi:MAG: hypothetical protein U1E46_13595 [Hyphomicrobiales bacterium]